MNKQIRPLLLSLVLLVSALQFSFSVTDLQKDWSLKIDKDGVKVYTRPGAEGALQDAKAICLMKKTKLSKAIELTEAVEDYPKWMYRITNSDLLKKEGNDFYIYTVVSTPWPLQDRDCVIYIQPENLPDGSLGIKVTGLPDYLPRKEGRVRMPYLEAYWTLTPQKEDLLVSYETKASPGGWIPDRLANVAATDLPFETIKNMKALLEAN